MEGDLLAARDAYCCGFLGLAEERLSRAIASTEFQNSASVIQQAEAQQLQAEIASAAGTGSVILANGNEEQQSIAHCQRILSPKTTTTERLESVAWLRCHTSFSPFCQSLAAFARGVTSADGRLPVNFPEGRCVSDVVAEIQHANPPLIASFLGMLTMILAERFDLAAKVYGNMLMSTDESTALQMAQIVMNLIQGNFSEAYLLVGDLETQLGVGSTSSSWTFETVRGLCLLHSGQHDEAIEHLQKAASITFNQEFIVLANLAAAYQMARQFDKANEVTKAIEGCCDASHPYRQTLMDLEAVAKAMQESITA